MKNKSCTYLINHQPTSFKVKVNCSLDEHNNVRISGIKSLSGNIIPLDSIKMAISKFKEAIENNFPDEIA